MVKIFFNGKRPELIFSLAAFSRRIDGQNIILVPADPLLLTKEEEIQHLTDDIPDLLAVLKDDEVNDIYVLGIGASNKTEEEYLKIFAQRHKDEIALWVDTHHWSEELLAEIGGAKKVVKLHPVSCLSRVKSLGYNIPPEWQGAENGMRMYAANPAILPENRQARRYGLILKVSQTTIQNRQRDYLKDDAYFSIYKQVVNEIFLAKSDALLDSLEDLGLLMTEEIAQAKERIMADSPYFLGAKKAGRPVGYLPWEEIEEYINLEEILEYGCKKYPWLFIIEYSCQGSWGLYLASENFGIKEFIAAYSQMAISKEEFLHLLNAEIVSCSTLV